MQWQPATKEQWYSLAIITVLLTAVGGLALLGAGQADAQTNIDVDTLNVTGENRTLPGNVTDATLETTLSYNTDVPNADRRTIRLKAGPVDGDTTLIDYTSRSIDGETSGTVVLSGSLMDHPELTADSLQPAQAGTTTAEIQVVAEIEVTRPDGEPVVTERRDTVTLTLRDDGTLVAEIGGTGSVTVQTDE